MQNIDGWDWTVFVVLLLGTCLLVVYGKRRQRRGDFLDYMLMGRQLTVPMFVATLAATWYGGIFGVTKIAFERGIYSFLTQGVFWYCTYIIFAFLLVPKIRNFKAVTLPQLVGQMFGKRSAQLSALFNIVNVLPIVYTISLGIFLRTISGIDTVPSTIIALTLVVVYTMFSGFRAIVYSDIAQFVIMYLAVSSVFFFSVTSHGGYDFLVDNLPTNHLTLLGEQGILTALVWGIIALSTLVDPNFYQRVFAARSEKVARWGIVITTCVWVTFDIFVVAGALYARAVFPNGESHNAYLVYALDLLPSGMKGILLAGICATILSTLDSYLFIAANSLAFDLGGYRHRRPQIIALITSAVITLLLAQLFAGNIPQVWKLLGTYSAVGLLLPVLSGYFISSTTINDRQFVTISISSILATTVWKFSPTSHHLDELYIGLMVSGLGIGIAYLMNRYSSDGGQAPTS